MGQFSKGSIEFLTVAVEFCKYMENPDTDRNEFLDKMTKLFPLIYMKAAMVKPGNPVYDDEPEKFVDENDYEAVKGDVAGILGEKDRYLTAVHPEISLSDTVVAASVSEDIADVYQSLKDFVEAAKIGNEDILNDALIVCINDFRAFWGTRLLCAELAMHQIIVNFYDQEEDPAVNTDPLFPLAK